ncbi:kinesin-like protein KIF6 [Gigantopelta aegis]|uniref:kinesin-like protein KIF6 n=1 Tax=Gigantopelta aegis TaxID=1735272 RepID=UPI001B889EAC|nr:kinesin-like protein KIF6 [Gigantopelta aegis]
MAHIRTYARLKPTAEPYDEYDISNNCLQIRVPEVYRDYGSSPGKVKSNICYDFKYDNVFNTDISQEDVFNAVAYDIIEGFLNGYNGTIFAYGQTGTGKTYTVEGSARKYSERGLAPRALSMIYQALAQRQDEEITAHISYIEIYQEVAYDLLTPGARTLSPVTPFPKVNVMEGPGGTCMIRNLSIHLAASEDVAQSLLLQGQANRKVAETPVNQRSSRSHAVLTVYLAAKKQDSDVIIRSKLHLVDLAGSERVAKTGVDGHQLTEAKSINLSLHHLETVIISLQTDSLANARLQQRTAQSLRSLSSSVLSQSHTPNNDGFRATRHVPYRNSLLTMVLRDSLGGNCQTAMIATLSLEWRNLGETLSTCRFAQRVACIANHAIRNEEIDDYTLIRRLKKRIAELESEISCLRLSQASNEEFNSEPAMAGKLTDEDKLFCAKVVHEYLGGRLSDPITAGITSPYKFRECFKVLKKMVLKGYFNPESVPHTDGKLYNGSPAQILKLDDNNNSSDLGEVKSNGTPVKPVQAWEDSETLQRQNHNVTFTVGSGQINRSSGGREVVANSPSERAPKHEAYKSPFERQREKEIHRLSKKLSLMEDTRQSKEHKLANLKQQVALQELETMETGIQAKLDVTLEQVSDQHAYLLQLKHTEARSDLLNQERLVERQLRKRQAKFEKKLEEIRKRKALILSEQSNDDSTEAPKSPCRQRVEERFAAQCKKRDGSLNTRQVFEMLKSEEKKQSKVQAQIEREHIMTKTRQLEIKEAATRLKLRELKEMFRRSKDDESAKPAYNGSSPLVAYRQANGDHPGTSSLYELARDHSPGHYPGFNSRRLDKALSFVNEESHVVKHDDVNEPTRPPSGVSVFSTGGARLPNNRLHIQGNSDNSLSSKWDSAYSTRPSTVATVSRPGTADYFTPRQEGTSRYTSSNCDDVGRANNNSASDLKVVDLSEATDDGRAVRQKHVVSENGHKYPSETLIPSQYVHAMRDEDVFDARKMALTSTTFDGALSSMLDESDRQLVYDNFSTEYYNQFARPGKNKSRHRPSPRKKSSKSARQDDSNLDDTMKLMMSQGPDSTNSPISAKLAKFLNSAGDQDRSAYSSPTRKKNRGKASKTGSDPFQSKLDEFNKSGFSEDGTDVQPKITALKEADRERVYMTKAQTEKERVEKIRKARHAAEVIQRAWRSRPRKE